MKVAWVHSFPAGVVSSGVFMHILARAVEEAGVEVVMAPTGPINRPDRLLRPSKALRRLAETCDIVHAQYGSGCGFVTSRLPGPKVLTLRGSDWYGAPTGRFKAWAHGRLAHWLSRRAVPRYDAILVVSERMRREVEPAARGRPVHVLPSGLNLDQFKPIDRAEARRALGEPDNKAPWVLFAALHLDKPAKRFPLARAAVELACKQRPEIELRIATGLPHDQIPLMAAACDALLLTSTHEGWPNVVKETLACNTPFVATDVADLRTIAEVEPTCHVAGDNPEALARALLDTLSRPRPDSLRRHAEPMDVRAITRRLLGIYEELTS
jgi:glycosyltransferase involved in cell wall biosynthesis